MAMSESIITWRERLLCVLLLGALQVGVSVVLRVAVVLVVDFDFAQAVDDVLDGEVVIDLLAALGCERGVDGMVLVVLCAFVCGKSY